MKKYLLLASALCLVLVLAACGANNNTNKGGNNEAADLGPATSELVITASNWEFDQKEYKIKAGETVNVSLKSIDGVHSVKILKSKFNDIKNNETAAVRFDEPGEYNIVCTVPCGKGHTTMKSKLIIE